MISAIILTKNEEENIVDCIECLKWCDEIIVIDDNSDDRTVELAKKENAIIYSRTLDNDFASQRNFAASKAKEKWLFYVDADERINDNLKTEIKSKLKNTNNEIIGYFIKREDIMWGKKLKYGETGNIRLLRLVRKENCQWIGKVHERINIQGKTDNLEYEILHYPHKTLNDFLGEINFYTDIRASELFQNKIRIIALDIIMYPLFKFINNYFVRLGLLDGVEGLIVATLMSFHSFLVRGKLWLLWQNK